jgi:cbb3-type cytochrome oxidase maturation protein
MPGRFKMEALFLTIAIAFIIALSGLVIFLVSVKNGQFEDIEAPKYRILFDDEKEIKNEL